MVDPVYIIKNVVRRVQTRLRRTAAPGRRRFKQYIGSYRLLRNQSLRLTPEEAEKYQVRILDGIREGALEMTDPDGWRYYADLRGHLWRQKGNERQQLEGLDEVPESEEPSDSEEGVDVTCTPEDPCDIESCTSCKSEEDEGDDADDEDGLGTDDAADLEEEDGGEDQDDGESEDVAGSEEGLGEPAEPDDLTVLQGIGGGRSRKLAEYHITTLVQVSEMPPADLAGMMGSSFTEEAARGVISQAAALVGEEG